MSEERDDTLHPISTRLGQLQRGLGRGMLSALACKSDAELEELSGELPVCLLASSSKDHDMLQRNAGYLAEVYWLSGASLTPLVDALFEREDWPESINDVTSIAWFFCLMLRTQREDVAAQLRKLLRKPSLALIAYQATEECEPEDALEVLPLKEVQLHIDTLSDSQLDELVTGSYELLFGGWHPWSDAIPRLQAAIERVNQRQADFFARGESSAEPPQAVQPPIPHEKIRALPTREVLKLGDTLSMRWLSALLADRIDEGRFDEVTQACMQAYDAGSDQLRWVIDETLYFLDLPDWIDRKARELEALLNKRGSGGFSVEEVAKIEREEGRLLAFFEDHPSEHCLQYGRAWIGKPSPLRTAAASIMEVHAEPCDAPAIRDALARCIAEGEDSLEAGQWIRAAFFTEDDALIDELAADFIEWRDPLLRYQVVVELSALADHPRRHSVLIESMRDAYDMTRIVAFEHLSLDAKEIRKWFEHIAYGPHFWEDDVLRTAAIEKLEEPELPADPSLN